MNMLESLFKAIGDFFGWKKQAEDPETIRLKKIADIDRQMEIERQKRDANMAIPRTKANQDALALDLGITSARIIRLREERKSLER